MRICNIGHARSRSSLLLSHLINYYSLVDFDESYMLIDKTVTKKSQYEKKFKELTDNFFLHRAFAVKIWPRWLTSQHYITDMNYFLQDLDYYLNLSKYDKIFVTKRNPVESICSLFLCEKFGYQYHGNRENLEYYSKRKRQQISITDLSDKMYTSFLTEILLVDRLCDYMDNKNISYEYLPFETIPNYLEKYYSLSQSAEILRPLPIDLCLNYRQIIKNYSDVEHFVEKNKIEIFDKINTLQLV